MLKLKSKQDRLLKVSPRQFYILGTNIAKLGWGKVTEAPELTNIQIVTSALLDEFETPREIRGEFESFLETKQSVNDLTMTLPRIKKLFGIYFASKYGKQNAGFFYIGFNMVNVLPMFELGSLRVNEVGPVVINQLQEIVGEARRLRLPTREINNIVMQIQHGIADERGEVFDFARLKLIEVGERYLELLGRQTPTTDNTC